MRPTRFLSFVGGMSAVLLLALPAVGADPTPQELAAAAKATGGVNGLCPVMNRIVALTGGSVTYRGEKIAFCCPGCSGKFQREPVRFMRLMRADPTKFAYVATGPAYAELAKAAQEAGTANGLCPVVERAVKAASGTVDHGGQKIGFCTPECLQKFKADPETYMRKMRADPYAYAYARPGPTDAELRAARLAVGAVNGLCPVDGRLVTPAAGLAEFEGERIAFSSVEARTKFAAAPQEYMRKMRLDPALHGYLPPVR